MVTLMCLHFHAARETLYTSTGTKAACITVFRTQGCKYGKRTHSGKRTHTPVRVRTDHFCYPFFRRHSKPCNGDHSTMATTFPCHGRIHIQNSSDKATTRSTRPTTTHPRPRCTVLVHVHVSVCIAWCTMHGRSTHQCSAGRVDVRGAGTTLDRSEESGPQAHE